MSASANGPGSFREFSIGIQFCHSQSMSLCTSEANSLRLKRTALTEKMTKQTFKPHVSLFHEPVDAQLVHVLNVFSIYYICMGKKFVLVLSRASTGS